jgi:hypothetical protein
MISSERLRFLYQGGRELLTVPTGEAEKIRGGKGTINWAHRRG